MARALGGGFVSAGLVAAERVWASDPVEGARRSFAEQVAGAHLVASNREVAEAAELVFLAVKPQQMPAALAELRPVLGAGHLVVSIAAGIPLANIAAGLAPGVRLMRVMPNTPCLVGMSASGYCRGP